MRFLSLLVVLFIVGLSLSGNLAKTISPDSTSEMVFGPERKPASPSQETGGVWEKLTALRLKDRKDICVWKICSRPLKTTTTVKPKLKNEEKAGSSSKIWIFKDKNGVYSFKVLKSATKNNKGPYGKIEHVILG